MLDYSKITELYGAPLNTVGSPNFTIKIKPWHVAVILVGAYIIYSRVKSIKNDNIIKNAKDKKDLI